MRLGDYATLFAGGTPSRAVSDYYGGTIPWCSISDISNAGKFLTRTEESLTSLGLEKSSAKLIPADAILFAMYASIGECSLATTPLATSQAILGIYNLKGFDREYLYYYLCSRKDAFINQGQTGTQSNLSKETLSNLQLPKPEIEEQCSIAVSLSTIDTNISALQSLIAKYEAIKKATVNLLLEPKKDWRCGKLADVCDNFTGLTYAPEDVSDSGILVLRSSNIQNEALSFADNVMVKCSVPERATVKAGDLLVCVRNGSRKLIGKSAVITSAAEGMAFGAFMTILRATALDQLFLSYLWQSSIIQKQIEESLGATINQITNADIKRFEIYYPTSIEDQRKIAEQISAIDKVLADYKAQLEKARQLKAGMMSYFFG